MSKIRSFRGGIHPDEYKNLTENLAFEIMPNPQNVILPISQHIGKPAKPLVSKKDEVKAGKVVAEAEGFIMALQISCILILRIQA